MSDRWDLELSCAVDGACPPRTHKEFLDAVRGEPELVARWTRYHAIGALMRGEVVVIPNGMAGRVAAAIATDPPFPGRSATVLGFPRRLIKPVGGLALAASVAAFTALGVWMMNPGGVATDASMAGATSPGSLGNGAATLVPAGTTRLADAEDSDFPAPAWAVPGGVQPATNQRGGDIESAPLGLMPERVLSESWMGTPAQFADYLNQHREYAFLGTVSDDLVNGDVTLDAAGPASR